MQIQQDVSANRAVVSLSGVLTFDELEQMTPLMAEMKSGSLEPVCFDLSGLTSIDSAGIGMLLMANDRIATDQTRFAIRGAQGVVAKSLQLARISEVLTVADT